MSSIRFRVYSKSLNRLGTVIRVNCLTNQITAELDGAVHILDPSKSVLLFDLGLFDKFGNSIYEGDILDDGNDIFVATDKRQLLNYLERCQNKNNLKIIGTIYDATQKEVAESVVMKIAVLRK